MTADMASCKDARVVVVGAGLMGVGIAQTFAAAGHSVLVVDSDRRCLAAVRARLESQLALLTTHGLTTAADAVATAARVETRDTLDAALSEATQAVRGLQWESGLPPLVVVEAVSEDLAVKQGLFRLLDEAAPPSALLWTNTSGLSITAIAQDLRHPERACGTHFWNPPHLIPLVEVVSGERTSEETLEQTSRLLAAAGKTPVVVRKDVPGFVGNRLLHALQREAMALVSSGVASAEEVDLVVTQGFGRRLGVVGPLAVCDLAGLDLILQVDSYLLRDLERSPHPDPLLKELVAHGDLGVRTLKGFLPWTEEDVATTIERRDAALIRALQAG
ncbi:MAG: 3-hydroxyacyl-CoA dehydrogenase family protein [Thermoleophilia bacterium]